MNENSSFSGGGWSPPPTGGPTHGRRKHGIPRPRSEVPKGAILGEVRGLQPHVEQDPLDYQQQWTVWAFRVQQFDTAGNLLSQVPVEMRGRALRGALRDGDWVEVTGGTIRAGTLVVDRVTNRTTKSVVQALPWRRPLWLVAVRVVVVIIFLVIMVTVVTGLIDAWESFGDFPSDPPFVVWPSESATFFA